MTSFDISLYGDGLQFLVDWDADGAFAHARSDVTENWYRCIFEYGTPRRTNPQRPTILAGRGSLTLLGDEFVPGRSTVFTEAQLRRRYRLRVLQGAVVLFEAWIDEARQERGVHAGGSAVQFRFEGILEQAGREQVKLSQGAAAVLANADAVVQILEDAYGLASIPVNLRDTPLGIYGFEGPVARYASQYSQVAGGFPTATKDGGLAVRDPNLTPASAKLFRMTDYAILEAGTEFDVEQLRNSALVPFIDRGGVVPQVVEGYQFFRSTQGFSKTFSLSLPPVPAGSTYENFSIAYAGKRAVCATTSPAATRVTLDSGRPATSSTGRSPAVTTLRPTPSTAA